MQLTHNVRFTPTKKMKRAREEEQTKDLVSCLMLLSKADDRKQPSSSGRVFACKTCEREFSSFQALGGHRASHKKPKLDLLQLAQPASSPGKAKTHGCPICGVEFTVGQALGGHMRRHRDVLSSAAVPVLKKSNSSKRIPWLNLDLNLAPPGYHLIS